MTVSKLSLEELSKIRKSNNRTSYSVQKENNNVNNGDRKPLSSRAEKMLKSSGHYFVDKLTNEEIENFFSQFDYISHARGRDLIGPINNSLIIDCAEISLIFDDFNCVYGIKDVPVSNKIKNFNLDKFLSFCNVTKMSPENSIETAVFGKLLSERFPSYAEIKHNYDEKTLNNAKKNILTPEMRNLFSTSTLMQQKSIDDMLDLKTTGSFDSGSQKILK